MSLEFDVVKQQLLAVYDEGFQGPAQKWSYFTGEGRESAMFGTLEALSAEQASRKIAGSTIAGHVYHVIFGLRAQGKFIRGVREHADWESSFAQSEVDDAAWRAMQQDLQAAYDETREAIEQHMFDDFMSYGGALSAAVHLAYHLGVIRQKALVIERGA